MSNKLDFSRVERIEPRMDSWDKVCARIDDEKKMLRFRILSAIPLAASIAIVALSVFMTSVTDSVENVSINSVSNSDMVSWYEGLGHNGDEFDTLDTNPTLSYLLKETK